MCFHSNSIRCHLPIALIVIVLNVGAIKWKQTSCAVFIYENSARTWNDIPDAKCRLNFVYFYSFINVWMMKIGVFNSNQLPPTVQWNCVDSMTSIRPFTLFTYKVVAFLFWFFPSIWYSVWVRVATDPNHHDKYLHFINESWEFKKNSHAETDQKKIARIQCLVWYQKV